MLELGPIEKDTHGLGPAFPKHPISRRGIQRRGAMGDQIGNAPLPALKRHNSSMISSMIKSSEVKMEGRRDTQSFRKGAHWLRVVETVSAASRHTNTKCMLCIRYVFL